MRILQPQNLLDVRHDVGRMPGMKSATGNKTARICFGVVGHPLVDFGAEANHFRRDVVDQNGAPNPGRIQMLQKRLGRLTELDDLVVVGPLVFDERQRLRPEHLQRLNVDVAVRDHGDRNSVKGEVEPYLTQLILCNPKTSTEGEGFLPTVVSRMRW